LHQPNRVKGARQPHFACRGFDPPRAQVVRYRWVFGAGVSDRHQWRTDDCAAPIVEARSGPRGERVSPGGVAGEIEFYDNATTNSGTIRLTLNVSTNQALDSLAIPGEGIKFSNGVYVSMPANTHLTVYYG